MSKPRRRRWWSHAFFGQNSFPFSHFLLPPHLNWESLSPITSLGPAILATQCSQILCGEWEVQKCSLLVFSLHPSHSKMSLILLKIIILPHPVTKWQKFSYESRAFHRFQFPHSNEFSADLRNLGNSFSWCHTQNEKYRNIVDNSTSYKSQANVLRVMDGTDIGAATSITIILESCN